MQMKNINDNLNKNFMKKTIANVPLEKAFWFCNGKVAKNLKEFSAILGKISLNEFAYHCNAQKNDFAKWINDVFGKKTLAKAIAKSKTAKEIVKKVKSTIN